MPARKAPAKQRRTSAQSKPKSAHTAPANLPAPTRPQMPAGYQIVPAKSESDFIPWSEVEAQLQRSKNYWICTCRSDGRPHAVPVWGVWVNGRVYFGTSPESRKGKNLTANPAIVVHLESGDEAIIIEGRARRAQDKDELAAVDEAYSAKYKMRVSTHPDSFIIAVEPHKVFAWRERDFNRRATRWVFAGASRQA